MTGPVHPLFPADKPPGIDGVAAPRFQLETPYGPDAPEGGLDAAFASKVLRVVRDGWEEMRELRPDVYKGLTIYGSLVKGRAHAGSDVDARVFGDPTAVRDIDKVAQADVRQYINARLADAGYDGPAASSGIHVVDMNPAILDAAMDKVLENAGEGGTFDFSLRGMDTVLPLFHFRLGSGNIQAYRSRVVQRLQDSSHGETVWGQMMAVLDNIEEADRREATIRLPRSLGQAASYFLL